MLLIIGNHYTRVYTKDIKITSNLWILFRKRKRNYFHTAAYKSGKWDGYINFFNKKTGIINTGLLPELITALKHWNVDYEIEDNRTKLEFLYENINENFLNSWLPQKEKPVQLHDYQVDFVNQILKRKRGIIHSPTSSGKTFILLSLLKCLKPGTKAMVLINRQGLVEQNYKELIKWGINNCGRFYDKRKETGDIIISTIQSIGNLKEHVSQTEVLIVDEVHEMMGDKYKTVYKNFNNACVRVALSATPFKWNGKDEVQKLEVKGIFGQVLRTNTVEGGVLTTKILQEKEILSPSICYFYPINQPDNLQFLIYQDAVTYGIAESIYFHTTVAKLAKSLKGRTLILVERIAHGDYLQNLIPNSLWIRGQDNQETREEVIEILKKSKENVVAIATKGIFNTGINVFIHNLINGAGGQADHEIIQRMGRGLRTAQDKEKLKYYDFIFNINDHLKSHSNRRVKILKQEGHEVIIKENIDF